jgi:ABC-type multidrug transport system fused ATPase/permease subunit
MSAGQLASFCMYAGHLAGSVSEISESTSGFLRAQGSGSRLFALLDKEPTTRYLGTKKLPEGYRGEIKFENVTFAYPDYPNSPVLRDVSLTVLENELLAVTGRSGCGKSSLLALVLRLYEPAKGRILLDGVDIRELDIDWLRSQIGTVRRHSPLFRTLVISPSALLRALPSHRGLTHSI